jgi:hypothetical protein
MKFAVCWKFSLIANNQALTRAVLHASCSVTHMDLSHIKLFALVPVLLTVFGCATVPSPSQPQVAMSPSTATMVGDAQQGDRVQLPTDNALGYSTVVVGRTYFAASGRQCRKLFSTNGTALPRVSCLAKNGVWQLARNLQPVSASMTSSQSMQSRNPVMQQIRTSKPASASSSMNDSKQESMSVDLTDLGNARESTDVVVVESLAQNVKAIDTVEDRLRANETLWAFAKRTTGNALNWEAIAELNGISDTNNLAVGASLSIPANLVDQGG